MPNTSTTELDLLKTVTTSGGATDSLVVTGTVSASPSNRKSITDANDTVAAYTYTLVSGSYRLDSIAYTSATVLAGHTATKSFTWADFGLSTQRVTNITWSYV